jgi:Cdc6-like AAA superfamily ATPase
MTKNGHEPDSGVANPFPAVPLGGKHTADTVTIPTAAVREAASFVRAYLSEQRPPDARGAGAVLAVVGEHGTGKTHLVNYLMQDAEKLEPRVQTMSLVARNRTFLELYLDFARALADRPDQVRDQVRAVYAEIVAASLARSELTARVAQGLTAGELDPVDVVERFGLMESAFHSELRDRFRRVTEDAEFATALTLLLRPAFAPAVWEWFLGRTPDPILQERGITTVIGTEELALAAIGVFVQLHHDAKHRFVLAIDELEQILLAADRPDDAAVGAFKRLLEVFTEANGLLVLSGLPEFVESLRPDVRQRIGRPVRMSPFSGEDLREFILERQRLTFGMAKLQPFTEETVDYLVALLGGLPRSLLRVCHELYLRATQAGGGVTPAMVRDVVRTQFNIAASKSVRREIRHTLDASGWDYLLDHAAGRPSTSVDYWVLIGDRGARCAIVLTDSVLNDDDVDALRRRVLALRADDAAPEILLVVLGVLPRNQAHALAELVGTEPLVYDPQSFGDDFEHTFTSTIGRYVESRPTGDDELGVIREWLERITRQQANVHGFVSQVSVHLDALRSSSDQRLLDIQRALGDLRRELTSEATDARSVVGIPQLPSGVAALFASANDALDPLAQVDPVLRDAFDRAAEELRLPGPGLSAPLQSTDVQRAAGVGFLLQRLVEAFHQAVREWYGSDAFTDRTDVLDSLCRTFDTIYEYLPVFRLDRLAILTDRVPGPDRPVAEASERSARQAIDGLGKRVQREVLTGLAGAG